MSATDSEKLRQNSSGTSRPKIGIGDLLSTDPDIIRRLWYVAPKPSPRSGWCVFSREFVLQSLQGCLGHPEHARRTMFWNALSCVVQACMLVVQIPVFTLGRIPIVHWFVSAFAEQMGRNPLGFLLRGSYYKARLRKLGQDTLIDQGVSIHGADRIEIGAHSIIAFHAQISCGQAPQDDPSGIRIGDFCFVGPQALMAGSGTIVMEDFASMSAGARVYSSMNTLTRADLPGQLLSMGHSAPSDQQNVVRSRVVIGPYAFVGINSVVNPGVEIGMAAVVHPFCEVQGSFPAFANIVGPGKAKQQGWRRPFRLDQRIHGGGSDAS